MATIECPFCGCEDAFHNGRGYECPDCGATWDDDCDFDDE